MVTSPLTLHLTSTNSNNDIIKHALGAALRIKRLIHHGAVSISGPGMDMSLDRRHGLDFSPVLERDQPLPQV